MSVRIIQGDVRKKLAELPAENFDCIVTSPPYYGLRDYGTATWEGGDPACDHAVKVANGPKQTGQGANGHASKANRLYRQECACGARRIDAQIGLEPTLDAYLETIVGVCRELRRVLKPSGVFFLNIGDSYAGSSKTGEARIGNDIGNGVTFHGGKCEARNRNGLGSVIGFKPKYLMLVPERLGILLQQDGWWVRSHIIWAKKNPRPESCTDRPTSAHETVWMLTKRATYFWDAEAVKEDAEMRPQRRGEISNKPNANRIRNLRNVWHMASHPYPDAHFATFPPELAERCIKAGSPRGGQILDPFAGAGTTGLVADRLGRDCTLIDLNTQYAEMALNRIRDDSPLFAEVAAE